MLHTFSKCQNLFSVEAFMPVHSVSRKSQTGCAKSNHVVSMCLVKLEAFGWPDLQAWIILNSLMYPASRVALNPERWIPATAVFKITYGNYHELIFYDPKKDGKDWTVWGWIQQILQSCTWVSPTKAMAEIMANRQCWWISLMFTLVPKIWSQRPFPNSRVSNTQVIFFGYSRATPHVLVTYWAYQPEGSQSSPHLHPCCQLAGSCRVLMFGGLCQGWKSPMHC